MPLHPLKSLKELFQEGDSSPAKDEPKR
jgi:hypothetical protein